MATVYSPPVSTYVALATAPFTADSSITFSNIPSGSYRHLIVVFSGTHATSNTLLRGYINGDTNANYTYVFISGDDPSVTSGASSASEALYCAISAGQGTQTIMFVDAGANNKHKTILATGAAATFRIDGWVNRWANNNPITSLEFHPSSSTITGTLSLYGIEA